MSLQYEKSPYLLQHLNDPVDWHGWRPETLEKAEREQKPIFLSIGYSSCHWCHVMQHEVFQNEELAKLLNQNFISIKVDREERPDIDKYFQNVYQLLNKSAGGWPTSVFLTHTKKPFYAGTYIPPKTSNGRIGFGELLQIILEKYQSEFDAILESGDSIESALSVRVDKKYMQKLDFSLESFVENYKNHISTLFEKQFGGFSKAPKFPHTSNLNTLLDLYTISKNKEFLHMSSYSLIQMAKGGFYDLVDGGFCRYSVDSRWNIPHFEKMLYDNSLLSETYLKAYFVTEKHFFKDIAFETLDFLIEKMQENNLFWSASDADTDHVEGKYFVYDFDEVYDEFENSDLDISTDEIDQLLENLDIRINGNFEGKSIVRNENLIEIKYWSKVREIFQQIRAKRTYPAIDKKIITSWNAMAIKSLFIASKIEIKYLEIAKKSLDTLLTLMLNEDKNILCHSTIGESKPEIEGFLEDYAYLSDATLEAYLRTQDKKYLESTQKILKIAFDKFFDKDKNIWYFSQSNDEFATEDDIFDNTYPSSSVLINSVIFKYSSIVPNEWLFEVENFINKFASEITKYPAYVSSLSDLYLQKLNSFKIIKTSSKNLEIINNQININLEPFLIIEINENSDEVQICDSASCKYVLKNQEEILKIREFLTAL
jgi:uncharacterized protein YyaL (SSP411 family)